MDFICTQENFKKGLFIVNRGISKTPSLPILSNIYLKIEESGLKLSTTDLEIGITCFVRGKVKNKNEITIPAKLLTNYVNNLPPSKIQIKIKDKLLNLKCDNYEGNIKGISPEEFPLIPKITGSPVCKIDSKKFKKALFQTIFAVASDDSRPEITGVYMSLSSSELKLASTDSYRMAEKVIPFNKDSFFSDKNKKFEIIIPIKILQELNRILSEDDVDLLDILISENQIKFNFNEVELISRLIEGRYPDYVQIIPKNFITEAELDKRDLINTLKTTSLFTKPGVNDIQLEFKPKLKEIEISAQSGQIGSNISKVWAEIKGKAEKINFNYKYLLEGLINIDSPKVFFGINGEAGPAAVKPLNDEKYIYVVMPIRQ